MPNREESLTRKTGRALSWNYLGTFTRLVLGFGINILLARLLGPKPFGELAVAMIIFSFGNLLASVGVGSALVQKESMTEEDIRFCFTVQMLVGAVMAVLLFVSAPALAIFFHQPGDTLILRVFSLIFLFQACGTTSTALLNREQDARHIQIISIVSYVISYLGIGIPLALRGAGIWSLVIAQLSQAFIGSLLSYLLVRHSVVPLLHPRHKGLLLFGLRILGANISSWGISNLDNTVVGRFAGQIPLGLYNRAFSLAAMPADSILSGLQRILLPAMSRVQSDTEKLQRVYAAAFGLVLMILAPIFAAMFVVPDVVILGLYGEKWSGAVAIFQPLALAIPIYAVMGLAGPLLAARGKPERELFMQLITVVVAAIAYTAAVQWSVLALSWTVLVVYILRFILLTNAANREIGGRWKDLMGTATPGLILSVVAATSAKIIDLALPRLNYPVRLGFIVLGTLLCVVVCFAIWSRQFLRPIIDRFPQFQLLLPARVRSLVL